VNDRSGVSARSILMPVSLGLMLAACSVGSTAIPSGGSTSPTAIPSGGSTSPTAIPSGGSTSPTAMPSQLQVGDANNGHSLTVVVGSEVTIQLGNTYWMIGASSDPTVLALVSGPTASGAAPSACLPGMGCGIVTAVFRALAPGQATISASRTTCGEALLCTGSAGVYEVTIVVSAASALSSASPVGSTDLICDTSQLNPTPSLTCRPALVAALAVLAQARPPIIREEFRWGGLCPPGAPCAPPLGDQGIVIIDFASGQPEFVYVSTAPGGVVAASSPAPYPSGY
jgi:hypothetical protein